MGNPIACARAACAVFALVAALVAASLGPALAQSNILDVTGTVTANDGTPIAGASVVLSAQGVAHGALSDALHASAPGYEAISQRTVTIDATNTGLAVSLSAATTNSLTVIGTVRASAGETVSTASAPSVTLNAQSAAAAGVTSVG